MRLVNRIYREQRELWSKEGIVVILRPITCFASIIAHTPPLPPGKRLIFQRETLDKFISSMLWICSTWLRFEYFNAASGVIGRFATWNLCSRENLLDITVEEVLSNKDSTMADPIREIRDWDWESIRSMDGTPRRNVGLAAHSLSAFPALSALVSLGLRDIWTPLDALIRGYATFCNGWLVLALNQYATPVFAYSRVWAVEGPLFSDCITIFWRT